MISLAAVATLLNLGASRLWDDDEPKNAACGHEMLASGNYVVPVFNHELREHKPVMLYWAMMAAYATLGVSEFTARLPSALASIATIFFCYQIGRMLLGRTTGLLAAALLASGVMFMALSRAATPDGLLIAFCMAALTSYVAGVRHARGGSFASDNGPAQLPWLAAVGMYASIGLAVLTKGPIGLLLPMTAITAFALFNATTQPSDSLALGRRLLARLAPARLLRIARDLRLTSGLAIVATICLPWYAAVSAQTSGEWTSGFLLIHNVGRFLSPMEGHRGTPLYHLVSVNAGMFPATCFLPLALFAATRLTTRRVGRSQPHALLLAWAGVWIVFFSIAATKLPNYVAPSYPAIALLIAAWLAAAARSAATSRVWLRVGLGVYTAVGIAAVGGLAFAAGEFFDSDYSLVLFGLAPLVGGAVALWLTRTDERLPHAVGAFATSALVFTVGAASLLAPTISGRQDSPRVAAAIQQLETNSADGSLPVATYRYTKPNLTFYLNRRVEPLSTPEELVARLRESSGVVVVPRDALERQRDRLPPSVVELASLPRVFKPGEEVVVIAGRGSLAYRADGATLLR